MEKIWVETKGFVSNIYSELKGHLKIAVTGLIIASVTGAGVVGETTGVGFQPLELASTVQVAVTDKESSTDLLLHQVLERLDTNVEPRIKDLEDARIRVTAGSLGDDCSGRNLPFVHFTDVTVNKGPSFTYGGEIRGTASSRIAIGTFTVTDGRFPNFNVSSSTIHKAVSTDTKTDGYDLDSLGTSTTSAVSIISMDEGWTFSGETEHAILSAQLSACGIDEVLLTNIDSNGDWLGEFLDIGTLNIVRGLYGDGDGPTLPNLAFADNVSVGTITINGITVEAVDVQ